MTTDEMQDTITDAEIADFGAKLAAWARQLTPQERVCLAALFVAGTGDDDAVGYLLVSEGASGTSPVHQATPVWPLSPETIRSILLRSFHFF